MVHNRSVRQRVRRFARHYLRRITNFVVVANIVGTARQAKVLNPPVGKPYNTVALSMSFHGKTPRALQSNFIETQA
jgi:hypothetical protein